MLLEPDMEFNMRMTIQLFKFTLSTISIFFSLQTQYSRADGGEDYYKALRKLKSFDPASLEEIKKNTIDAEQIKKVNALSKENYENTKKMRAIKNKVPDVDSAEEGNDDEMIAAKKSGKKTPEKSKQANSPSSPKSSLGKKTSTNSGSSSAPIKVNSETPDELTFPGSNDDEGDKETGEPTVTPIKK